MLGGFFVSPFSRNFHLLTENCDEMCRGKGKKLVLS